jgi:hypothetical protein
MTRKHGFFLVMAFLGFYSSLAMGWGQLGHYLTPRMAAKLIASHPKIIELRHSLITQHKSAELVALDHFLDRFFQERLELGHLGNIPDTFWRRLAPPFEDLPKKWGNDTHFMNMDAGVKGNLDSTVAAAQFPLDYDEAKAFFDRDRDGKNKSFIENGTMPWRAQQFADLYRWALVSHVSCKDEAHGLARKWILSYAGLLTHFLADGSMPLHSATDYDGYARHQGGVHWYFENDLVNELEPGLEQEVFTEASLLLKSPERFESSPAGISKSFTQIYPKADADKKIVGLALLLLKDSYTKIKELEALDEKYAIATLGEAISQGYCNDVGSYQTLKSQLEAEKDPKIKKSILASKVLSGTTESDGPACRRPPNTLVNADGSLGKGKRAKTVAEWNHKLIVSRLALSTALIADVWVDQWLQAGRPDLCIADTFSLRPLFISPNDPSCFGYASLEKGASPTATEKCLAE